MSRLDEIKARLAKATPGPWVVDEEEAEVIRKEDGVSVAQLWWRDGKPRKDWDCDAEFIANAPTDIAFLISKVERLEKALDEILYHYPTPIDIELDYEKAYDEVKEIAKRAKEESD